MGLNQPWFISLADSLVISSSAVEPWKTWFELQAHLHVYVYLKKKKNASLDFSSGPVVKNLPSNAENAGSIFGWRAKIPHAEEQLIPHISTTEPMQSRACLLQLRPDIAKKIYIYIYT